GNLADADADVIPRCYIDRPDIQVALDDRAGLRDAARDRATLIAWTHADRPGRMRHGEAVRAGSVEPAVEAGDEDEIRSRHRCRDAVERRGVGSGGGAQDYPVRRPQSNPRPEV